MIEPRGATGSEAQALMDVDRASGKSKSDTAPATPKKKLRGEISPTPSRANSPSRTNSPSNEFSSPQPSGLYLADPTQRTETIGALTTTPLPGTYHADRANSLSEVALLNEEIENLRQALLNSENRVRHEELRCINV